MITVCKTPIVHVTVTLQFAQLKAARVAVRQRHIVCVTTILKTPIVLVTAI